MKITIIIIILCFMNFSCTENTHTGKESYVSEELEKQRHEDELKKQILRYTSRVNDSTVLYTLEFYNEKMFSVFTEKDTILLISTYNCGIDYKGYKGVFKVDNFKILVFDNCELGGEYYNHSNLTFTDLSSFECMEDKIRSALTFRISNDKLTEWQSFE